MGYAEVLERREKALEAGRLARKERDDKEAELPEVQELMLDPDNIVIHCHEASPDLPGFVICHRPSAGQTARFKQILWKEGKERGVVEAKAKAGEDLARNSRKYPSAELYAVMVAKYGMLPDKIAKVLIEAGEAGADEAGKG